MDSSAELFLPNRLDRDRAEPLHRQLCAELRASILDGRVAPGAKLPSTRDLASGLAISRNTVIEAFQQLIAEGMLVARHGAGTFVAGLAVRPVPSVRADGGEAATGTRRLASTPGLHSDAVMLRELLRNRSDTPARAFRVAAPSLRDFPRAIWARVVARSARRLTVDRLGDAHPEGLGVLRERVAEYLRANRAVRCEPARIVITAGSQQALDLLGRILLDPGDPVWIEDPGYPGARVAFRSRDAQVHAAPVDAQGLDVASAARDLPAPRVIYCTPSSQFPLGSTMSVTRRQMLLDYAARTGAWILEDDYDSEYRYGSHPVPALQSLDTDHRVIYLGTFSKTMFPALRVGFAVLPADLVHPFCAARVASSWYAPALDQLALAEFIEQGHFARHVKRMRALYAQRRDALSVLGRRALPHWTRLHLPNCGLNAWLELPAHTDEAAVASAAGRRGVEVVPLAALSAGDRARRGLVLGFAAVSPEDARVGMAYLREALLETSRSSGSRRAG